MSAKPRTPESERQQKALVKAVLWWGAFFFIGGNIAAAIFRPLSDGAGDLAKGLVGVVLGGIVAYIVYKKEMKKPLN